MTKNFIPEIWSQGFVDYVSRDGIVVDRLFDLGRECMWHEDWTTVIIDGERFKPEEVKTELLDSGAVEVRGSKVVTRSVRSDYATDGLETLLEQWRDDGKGDMADALLAFRGDGCGCCGGDSNVFSVLCRDVKQTVERVALVEDCMFYAAPPRGAAISIPKYDSFEIVTTEPDAST